MQSQSFRCFLRLSLLITLLSAVASHAKAEHPAHLPGLLEQHRSIVLLIDPQSGRILDANPAAESFYKLDRATLLSRSVQDFNLLGQHEVELELARALSDEREYFIFPHRIATGEIRTVEVHSSPVTLDNGQPALLSILHDITGKPIAEESMLGYQARLEALVDERSEQLLESQAQRRTLFLITLVAQSLLILMLLYVLYRYHRLSKELNRERRSLLSSQAYNRQLSKAVEQSPDSILISDAKGNIQFVNDAFLKNTGYSRKEVIGKNPKFRQSGSTPRTTYEDMWRNLLQGNVWRGELFNRRKDHTESIEYATIAPVRDDQGDITHYLSIQQDVSAQREAEAQVHQLSYFDPLTNLPNRKLLIEWLEQGIGVDNRPLAGGALLLLNIDRFKKFNEAHNLLMGDALLKAFAERLSSIIKEGVSLARTSGDEFALLLGTNPDRVGQISHHALALAECIQSRLETPISIEGEFFVISVSIGITTFSSGVDERPADILRQADVALHRAKTAGGKQLAFFENVMGEEARRSFNIERALRLAIPNQELVLHIQPQVNAQRQVVGAEALIRWQHPEKGLISPAEFIPIAEESDLINDLGNWVLHEACTLIKYLNDSGHSMRIAVNISARHFHQADFVDTVKMLLLQSQANPKCLTLEITESLVIDHIDQVIAKMNQLAELGIHFSLDDFGTGYSSLAYLKRLPINELKIDRTFVQDAPINPRDAALVETIMAVARHMKLTLVAEGIENQAQSDFFKDRGEVVYQGYFYGKPKPIQQWLQRWTQEGVLSEPRDC
ncbi:MAG: EAL domain-containing protein [Saccharospirillum sp.]|nr:EAL domain-containing protein [Saccharospirillum sp.]